MFSHLHAHSEYSIADGLHSPKAWAKAIAEAGFKAHALTDHGTMAGIMPFYYEMRDRGLNPIIGCEFYFVDDPTSKEERRARHLILLAKNYDGFQNLLKLQLLSNTDGFYYRPRIGVDWLRKYGEGLVCLSACLGGVLSIEYWDECSAQGITDDKPEPKIFGLEERFDQFVDIFGKDFYVEFQGHDSDDQRNVQTAFYDRLRKRKGFQHVMTNDCHYIHPDHSIVQGLLKQKAYGEAATSYTTFDSLYLKTPGEVYEAFTTGHGRYLPKRFMIDGMQATEEIVEKCRVELPTKHYLPSFPTKKMKSEELFKQLTTQKLKLFLSTGNLHGNRKEYLARFAKEYKVICRYNLQDYFLIVWDICRYARSKGIYVGLGRGSSAGSLISFLLQIVAIDPIRYKLLFERFLNENRCENGELPDVDLDFESDRRHEIKEYVVRRYGAECVCEIGTYGRLRLKNSIVDFGKLFNYNYHELQAITTKLDLPTRQNRTDEDNRDDLESALSQSPRLRSMLADNPNYHLAITEVQGQIKSQSVHPAGVIICSEPIANVTPLKTQKKTGSKDRIIVTQAEDKFITRQGMVKMDFLGLKEYDINKFVIENSDCKYTMENYIQEIEKIAWSGKDEVVWDMFRRGETDAVFQFSSDGMKELLRNMKANTLQDLIAAVALYRPGCLKNGWHDKYCRRKHGEEEVEYPHPDLKEALSDTYGVIIFQEQFMEVFHTIGGIALTDADTIRSALGKKDKEKLAKFKSTFIKNASKKLKGKDKAEELWTQIEAASGYTFNRSHSAVYALLAYISQTFKVHEPGHFWAAVLEWDCRKRKMNDMLDHLRSAKNMGISPLMPDINKSKVNFDVETEIPWHKKETLPAEIYVPRWSLAGISGSGPKACAEIVSKRPALGFSGIKDFYYSVNKSKVKWDAILKMAYAGAFDSLGERKHMITWLYAQKPDKKLPAITDSNLLLGFYDAMGFFDQSLKEKYPEFKNYTLSSESEVRDYAVNTYDIAVGGMLMDVKSNRTARGMMGKAKLVDQGETLELNFFSDEFAANRTKIKNGNIVVITQAKKSGYGGKENLLDCFDVEIISASKK